MKPKNQKLHALFLSIILTLTAIPVFASNTAPQGAGTHASPYIISAPAHLLWMNQELTANGAARFHGRHFRLANDITAPNSLISIGISVAFQGIFDGGGHTITLGTSSAGLFVHIGQEGIVRNLGVAGEVYAPYISTLGTVASTNSGVIENTFSTADIFAGGGTGGLVGYNTASGVLRNVFTTGDVSGISLNGAGTGGIAGTNRGLIENAFSLSDVSSRPNPLNDIGAVGGIVGWHGGTPGTQAVVRNTFATGVINNNSNSHAGGLVGRSGAGTDLIQRSVALNSNIIFSTTGDLNLQHGRVATTPVLSGFSNNYASAGMTLNNLPYDVIGTHTDFHGYGVSPLDYQDQYFWKEILGWCFDEIWEWDGSLPALQMRETLINVTGVSINQNNFELLIGETKTLTATVHPTGAAIQSVHWSTNAPQTASVNISTGLVSGVSSGTAVITVTTEDGGFTDSVNVRVIQQEQDENGNGDQNGNGDNGQDDDDQDNNNQIHPTTFTLTVTASSGGSIAIGEGSFGNVRTAAFPPGARIPVSAQASNNYTFYGWVHNFGYLTNPYQTATTFIMPNRDVTVWADFMPNRHFRRRTTPPPRPTQQPTQPADPTGIIPASQAQPFAAMPFTQQTADSIDPAILTAITDPATALSALETAVTILQNHPNRNTYLAIFAEQAIARAASSAVAGDTITITQSNVLDLQAIAQQTRTAVTNLLRNHGITLDRALRANISFSAAATDYLTIQAEPFAMQEAADRVLIRTPHYDLTLPPAAEPITITIGSQMGLYRSPDWFPGAERQLLSAAPMHLSLQPFEAARRSYTVSFSRPVTEPVRIAVPPTRGNASAQTLTDENGEIKGGNLNPITGLLEARITQSGTYTVIENQVDFADIQGRSAEMQRAIRTLASQGIISGVAPGRFSPDETLNRAQMASLIMSILGRLDPNADGGFTDVRRSDWFFGAAGSAARHEIMVGTRPQTFSPTANLPREQMLSVVARVLRTEMRYTNPTNPTAYLNEFADMPNIAAWSAEDIALAARENLVIRRADSQLIPAAPITRGEAAIILYRLYRRIW